MKNKINTIVFATHNNHKLSEIREIADGRIEILGLNEIGCHNEIYETGLTLEENALIKAKYVKDRYGYDCFADDTGLEVDALNGAPGVFSARYAGSDCNPENNIVKLISALEGTNNRAAQFRTVIALIYKGREFFFDGVINGTITNNKRGSNGFGYDPIFIPDGFQHTFAELDSSTKNQISHRARAMTELFKFLLNQK